MDWRNCFVSMLAAVLAILLACGTEPLQGPLQETGSTSGRMKQIPGGTFTMGSNDTADQWAWPWHRVTVTGFWIDSTDITQAQYQEVMDTNPSSFRNPNNPVEEVNWWDAVRYCIKRSISEGRENCYDTTSWTCDITKNGYRLPTEAEWEYACRAGTTTKYYWGDDTSSATINQYAWYDANSNTSTYPVAQKKPNALGLYDITGNVAQWCNDWYEAYSSTAQTDPTGAASGMYRSIRGGSFVSYVIQLRSAYRNRAIPGKRYIDVDFRCVRR